MNKKIFNLVVLLVMLLVLMYGLTGCSQKPSEEDANDAVIKEMEEVYGDKFTVIRNGVNVSNDLFGTNPVYEVFLESENLDNKEIKVDYRYNKNSGKYDYEYCNYNFIKYEEEILEELEVLDEIYDDYKLLLSPRADDMVKVSYEEYKESENTLQMHIIVSPNASKSNKEKDFEKLRKSLEENELLISRINIIYTNEEDVFDELDSKDEDDIIGYARLNGGIEGMFYLDEDYKTKDMSRWVEHKKSKTMEK